MGIQTASIQHGDEAFDRKDLGEIVGHCSLTNISDWQCDDQIHYVKTHGLAKGHHEGLAAIQIVRDGRDAMVSYAHYRRAVDRQKERFQDVLTSLIMGSHRNWSKHTFSWQRDAPCPVTIVKYEDLIQGPLDVTTRALDSLSLPYELTGNSMPRFEYLHNCWPDFFRKGQVGNWHTEMTEQQHELFWAHHEDAMELLGYT